MSGKVIIVLHLESYFVPELTRISLFQSNLGTEKTTLTAFDATNFSRTISNSKLLDGGSSNHLHYTENINKSMFPFIYKHLCFSCSRDYSEMKHTLPNHVQNLLKEK